MKQHTTKTAHPGNGFSNHDRNARRVPELGTVRRNGLLTATMFLGVASPLIAQGILTVTPGRTVATARRDRGQATG